MELVLRQAVPDTIGPVEGAFLTDMFHQIADDLREAVEIAHVLAPGELAVI